MDDKEKKKEVTSSYWVEKVVIITESYEVIGNIYMPKTTKRSRMLSELLNSSRKFIAVKDCTLQSRINGSFEPEILDFMEINVNSIIIIKPYRND